MRRPELEEYLWSKVSTSETDCLEWRISDKSKTYGRVVIDGKAYGSHRAMWTVIQGDIPEGMFVCHSCDNKLCVNPGHLYLGDNKENQLDAVAKGIHWTINPQSLKTACPKGHPYDATNSRGDRVCSLCRNESAKRYRARKRMTYA